MLRITSSDWPIQQVAVPQPHQQPSGIAPLRHELALARYEENRLRYDPLAGRRLASWSGLVATCRSAEQRAIAVLHGVGVLPPAWVNHRP
jgi:hypothetical protein